MRVPECLYTWVVGGEVCVLVGSVVFGCGREVMLLARVFSGNHEDAWWLE
jgi:hypothetical protein